jgi:hypothetical protein
MGWIVSGRARWRILARSVQRSGDRLFNRHGAPGTPDGRAGVQRHADPEGADLAPRLGLEAALGVDRGGEGGGGFPPGP